MTFAQSAEDQAFREEVSNFIAENLPGHLASKVELGHRLTRDDFVE